jgi:ribosomal protein L16 Arg81 hydroxylase
VGEKVPMKQHCPHPDLLQVDPFEGIIDEELEPGDILYIPPGFPHEGYSLENSLNYSVGFRAPPPAFQPLRGKILNLSCPIHRIQPFSHVPMKR